uniref:Uncharacterized protein n=1 Tax=Anabas testudineus TaxID=64144 RepID=A0AAQ6ILV6_ANATE
IASKHSGSTPECSQLTKCSALQSKSKYSSSRISGGRGKRPVVECGGSMVANGLNKTYKTNRTKYQLKNTA